MTTPKFAHCDTTQPDGFYIQFERLEVHDNDASPLEYLFQDDDYQEQDQERLDAFNSGQWHFIGIRALAKCMIVQNGTGTYMNLESAGLWATESDSGNAHLESVYQEEKAELLAMIDCMKSPIIESE